MRRDAAYPARAKVRRARMPLACAAAALLTGCAHPPGDPTSLKPPASNQTPPQYPLPADLPGLPNFGFVTHDIWRGGEPSAAGLARLAQLGVKTVIDLREDDALPDVLPPGIRLVRLPVSAWRADGVDPWKLLHAIKTSPTPIYIHCREGRDRTGLAVAEYRLAKGMSAADACRELRNFHVNLWWEIAIELRIYRLQPLLSPTPPPPKPQIRSARFPFSASAPAL